MKTIDQTSAVETVEATNTKGFFTKACESVSNVYHNPTVRKAALYTAGAVAVIGGGYLAFKYFGGKAAEVLPEVAGNVADVATQTVEAVAEATTSA